MTGPDILFVTRKWAPAVGGMETWSHRLSGELAKLAPVAVIALPGKANGHPPGTAALLAFPWTVLRRYFARKSAPDVLHLGDMAIWPLGLLAALRRGKTRVVLTAHGTDVSYPRRGGFKGAAYGAYLRLGARLLGGAVVTTNSPATAAAARDSGWRNTRVIPLGTDIAGLVPSAPPGRHVLFAGRLIAQKGCSWFINQVLPLLDDDICLHVAGTRIEPAETAALGHPRVRYLGTLTGSQLADAYRSALAVVVPNIERPSGEFEGFGLVAIEAAAAGGVVLAADCGGLPAAVIDGESGFLVRSGDAAAWQAEIARAASWDLPERQSFISNALAQIDQHYRWPRVAAETLSAYADCAE